MRGGGTAKQLQLCPSCKPSYTPLTKVGWRVFIIHRVMAMYLNWTRSTTLLDCRCEMKSIPRLSSLCTLPVTCAHALEQFPWLFWSFFSCYIPHPKSTYMQIDIAHLICHKCLSLKTSLTHQTRWAKRGPLWYSWWTMTFWDTYKTYWWSISY